MYVINCRFMLTVLAFQVRPCPSPALNTVGTQADIIFYELSGEPTHM